MFFSLVCGTVVLRFWVGCGSELFVCVGFCFELTRVTFFWMVVVGFSQSLQTFFRLKSFHFLGGRVFFFSPLKLLEKINCRFKPPGGGKSLRRLFLFCFTSALFLNTFWSHSGPIFWFIFGLFFRSFLDYFLVNFWTTFWSILGLFFGPFWDHFLVHFWPIFLPLFGHFWWAFSDLKVAPSVSFLGQKSSPFLKIYGIPI